MVILAKEDFGIEQAIAAPLQENFDKIDPWTLCKEESILTENLSAWIPQGDQKYHFVGSSSEI